MLSAFGKECCLHDYDKRPVSSLRQCGNTYCYIVHCRLCKVVNISIKEGMHIKKSFSGKWVSYNRTFVLSWLYCASMSSGYWEVVGKRYEESITCWTCLQTCPGKYWCGLVPQLFAMHAEKNSCFLLVMFYFFSGSFWHSLVSISATLSVFLAVCWCFVLAKLYRVYRKYFYKLWWHVSHTKTMKKVHLNICS